MPRTGRQTKFKVTILMEPEVFQRLTMLHVKYHVSKSTVVCDLIDERWERDGHLTMTLAEERKVRHKLRQLLKRWARMPRRKTTIPPPIDREGVIYGDDGPSSRSS